MTGNSPLSSPPANPVIASPCEAIHASFLTFPPPATVHPATEKMNGETGSRGEASVSRDFR